MGDFKDQRKGFIEEFVLNMEPQSPKILAEYCNWFLINCSKLNSQEIESRLHNSNTFSLLKMREINGFHLFALYDKEHIQTIQKFLEQTEENKHLHENMKFMEVLRYAIERMPEDSPERKVFLKRFVYVVTDTYLGNLPSVQHSRTDGESPASLENIVDQSLIKEQIENVLQGLDLKSEYTKDSAEFKNWLARIDWLNTFLFWDPSAGNLEKGINVFQYSEEQKNRNKAFESVIYPSALELVVNHLPQEIVFQLSKTLLLTLIRNPLGNNSEKSDVNEIGLSSLYQKVFKYVFNLLQEQTNVEEFKFFTEGSSFGPDEKAQFDTFIVANYTGDNFALEPVLNVMLGMPDLADPSIFKATKNVYLPEDMKSIIWKYCRIRLDFMLNNIEMFQEPEKDKGTLKQLKLIAYAFNQCCPPEEKNERIEQIRKYAVSPKYSQFIGLFGRLTNSSGMELEAKNESHNNKSTEEQGNLITIENKIKEFFDKAKTKIVNAQDLTMQMSNQQLFDGIWKLLNDGLDFDGSKDLSKIDIVNQFTTYVNAINNMWGYLVELGKGGQNNFIENIAKFFATYSYYPFVLDSCIKTINRTQELLVVLSQLETNIQNYSRNNSNGNVNAKEKTKAVALHQNVSSSLVALLYDEKLKLPNNQEKLIAINTVFQNILGSSLRSKTKNFDTHFMLDYYHEQFKNKLNELTLATPNININSKTKHTSEDIQRVEKQLLTDMLSNPSMMDDGAKIKAINHAIAYLLKNGQAYQNEEIIRESLDEEFLKGNLPDEDQLIQLYQPKDGFKNYKAFIRILEVNQPALVEKVKKENPQFLSEPKAEWTKQLENQKSQRKAFIDKSSSELVYLNAALYCLKDSKTDQQEKEKYEALLNKQIEFIVNEICERLKNKQYNDAGILISKFLTPNIEENELSTKFTTNKFNKENFRKHIVDKASEQLEQHPTWKDLIDKLSLDFQGFVVFINSITSSFGDDSIKLYPILARNIINPLVELIKKKNDEYKKLKDGSNKEKNEELKKLRRELKSMLSNLVVAIGTSSSIAGEMIAKNKVLLSNVEMIRSIGLDCSIKECVDEIAELSKDQMHSGAYHDAMLLMYIEQSKSADVYIEKFEEYQKFNADYAEKYNNTAKMNENSVGLLKAKQTLKDSFIQQDDVLKTLLKSLENIKQKHGKLLKKVSSNRQLNINEQPSYKTMDSMIDGLIKNIKAVLDKKSEYKQAFDRISRIEKKTKKRIATKNELEQRQLEQDADLNRLALEQQENIATLNAIGKELTLLETLIESVNNEPNTNRDLKERLSFLKRYLNDVALKDQKQIKQEPVPIKNRDRLIPITSDTHERYKSACAKDVEFKENQRQMKDRLEQYKGKLVERIKKEKEANLKRPKKYLEPLKSIIGKDIWAGLVDGNAIAKEKVKSCIEMVTQAEKSEQDAYEKFLRANEDCSLYIKSDGTALGQNELDAIIKRRESQKEKFSKNKKRRDSGEELQSSALEQRLTDVEINELNLTDATDQLSNLNQKRQDAFAEILLKIENTKNKYDELNNSLEVFKVCLNELESKSPNNTPLKIGVQEVCQYTFADLEHRDDITKENYDEFSRELGNYLKSVSPSVAVYNRNKKDRFGDVDHALQELNFSPLQLLNSKNPSHRIDIDGKNYSILSLMLIKWMFIPIEKIEDKILELKKHLEVNKEDSTVVDNVNLIRADLEHLKQIAIQKKILPPLEAVQFEEKFDKIKDLLDWYKLSTSQFLSFSSKDRVEYAIFYAKNKEPRWLDQILKSDAFKDLEQYTQDIKELFANPEFPTVAQDGLIDSEVKTKLPDLINTCIKKLAADEDSTNDDSPDSLLPNIITLLDVYAENINRYFHNEIELMNGNLKIFKKNIVISLIKSGSFLLLNRILAKVHFSGILNTIDLDVKDLEEIKTAWADFSHVNPKSNPNEVAELFKTKELLATLCKEKNISFTVDCTLGSEPEDLQEKVKCEITVENFKQLLNSNIEHIQAIFNGDIKFKDNLNADNVKRYVSEQDQLKFLSRMEAILFNLKFMPGAKPQESPTESLQKFLCTTAASCVKALERESIESILPKNGFSFVVANQNRSVGLLDQILKHENLTTSNDILCVYLNDQNKMEIKYYKRQAENIVEVLTISDLEIMLAENEKKKYKS